MKILIADGLSLLGKEEIKKIPAVFLDDPTELSSEELFERIAIYDILIVRSKTQVTKELLERAKNLKLVIRAGIGLDNVDIKAATERGIAVQNAPTGNIVTTAEHTLALMFAVSRHIASSDSSLRKGQWEKKKFQGNELRGKTVGILGVGNIGKVVAKKCLLLEMKVLAFDPYLTYEMATQLGIELVSFDELLKKSDYVTLHVPLNEKTHYLINKEALEKMKKSAFLINCARGGLIDEMALTEALSEKKIAGCALDVFEEEPLSKDHPLFKFPNTVLTPHLGASTDEAQIQVGLEVAEQVKAFVNQGVYKNAVNVPNISPEEHIQLKPYLTLGERLGKFLSQSFTERVNKIKICYQGSVTDFNKEVITLSILKGFLSSSSSVNYVNARDKAKEKGLSVEETFKKDCADYPSLIEISLEGESVYTVSGTLFGKKEPRIVRINQYLMDAVPEGVLLLSQNHDEPGVIGKMGTLLGDHGINIARMHLGLDRKNHLALAIVSIDSKVPLEVMNKLLQVKGMISVQQINLCQD